MSGCIAITITKSGTLHREPVKKEGSGITPLRTDQGSAQLPVGWPGLDRAQTPKLYAAGVLSSWIFSLFSVRSLVSQSSSSS